MMSPGNADDCHILKCALCKKELVADARLLPCERSVCGACFHGLKAGLDEAKNFICKSCSKRHRMPDEGLPEKLFLYRIAYFQPVSEQIGEGAKNLKIFVEHLPDQEQNLNSREDSLEINTNDDDSEMEVIFSTAMTIKDFVQVQNDPRFVDFMRYQIQLSEDLKNTSSIPSKNSGGKPSRHGEKSDEKIDEFKTKLRDSMKRHKKETAQKSPRSDDRASSGQSKKSSKDGPRHQRKPSRVLHGHTDYVRKVVFLPDGTLASCSDDKTIRIWNLENGQPILELKGHTKWVYSIVSLPNGCLASCSVDQTIKIWDLKERKAPRNLIGHKSCVIALVALHNGNLASCSFDDTIKIWHVASGNQLYSLNGHCIKRWISPLGVLSDGSLVALLNGLRSTIVRIWNPVEGRIVKSIETGLREALSVLVLTNDTIAVGFKDGTIKIIDPKNINHVKTLKSGTEEVCLLSQLPNGHLISCGFRDDSNIKIWDPENGRLVKTLPNDHKDAILSLSVSSDGRVAFGSTDNTIRILNLQF